MHGRFAWYELVSGDVAAATGFYGAVVGWTAEKQGEDYTVLKLGDAGMAGVFPLTDEMRVSGAQPGWIGYVVVDAVDDTAAEIGRRGGAIKKGPQDIPGMLRFAVATDPQGVPFVVFTPDPAMGDPVRPQPPVQGTVGWHELVTPDPDAAWHFYAGLFGWKKARASDMGPMGTYQTFGLKDDPEAIGDIGGMMKTPPGAPAPGWWTYYIHVDALGAAIERVKAAGGSIVNGPHQVPGGGWIAQGLDREGAMFSLVGAQP
jgi:predicted enzyme related to lactoylglutathione lyase